MPQPKNTVDTNNPPRQTKLDKFLDEENFDAILKTQVRQVKWLYNNSNKFTNVYDEKLVRLLIHKLTSKLQKKENDLLDALDLKEGKGSTALSILQNRIKDLNIENTNLKNELQCWKDEANERTEDAIKTINEKDEVITELKNKDQLVSSWNVDALAKINNLELQLQEMEAFAKGLLKHEQSWMNDDELETSVTEYKATL